MSRLSMSRLTAPARGSTPAAVEHARVAVAVTFLLNGFAFASWLSRVPSIRDVLGLTPGQLGVLLLALSVGTLIALPLTGAVIARIGPTRTVATGVLAVAVGALVIATGLGLAETPVVALGLVASGVGMSGWDVAMNVEGADVERRLGRTLMPRFHAAFSFGTVLGALTGAGAAGIGVGVATQLALTAPVVLVVGALALRFYLPAVHPSQKVESPRGSVLAAWREPRTRLVGLLVLCFALAEGVANDWIALATVDGHHAGESMGALAFGVFVAAMTASRLTGGWFLDRFGRVRTLRTTAVLAAFGALLVVFSPGLPGLLAGALLWGAGAALGFPVGMSAAADDPARAAARVSVVSSIGYTAFLAGPPLVGFLADGFGVLRALLVVVAATAIGALVASSTRPLR